MPNPTQTPEADLTALSTDDLLDRATAIKAAQKCLEGDLTQLQEELMHAGLHDPEALLDDEHCVEHAAASSRARVPPSSSANAPPFLCA